MGEFRNAYQILIRKFGLTDTFRDQGTNETIILELIANKLCKEVAQVNVHGGVFLNTAMDIRVP
jgi:hypothetical protein